MACAISCSPFVEFVPSVGHNPIPGHSTMSARSRSGPAPHLRAPRWVDRRIPIANGSGCSIQYARIAARHIPAHPPKMSRQSSASWSWIGFKRSGYRICKQLETGYEKEYKSNAKQGATYGFEPESLRQGHEKENGGQEYRGTGHIRHQFPGRWCLPQTPRKHGHSHGLTRQSGGCDIRA